MMVSNPSILLSIAYFAPIQYFSKLAAFPEIYIERHENFIKQTYRNRTVILGANGPIPLIVPVEKGRGQKIKISDIRIAYDEDWQRNHWRTIFSAYNSSPYFEYYIDEIKPFFLKKYEFLFDFNLQITEKLIEILEIETGLKFTGEFEQVPETCLNFRERISPKINRNAEDSSFRANPFTQVFSDKFGFVPNLSILDLLFNEGPSAHSRLIDSFCFILQTK